MKTLMAMGFIFAINIPNAFSGDIASFVGLRQDAEKWLKTKASIDRSVTQRAALSTVL